jgi:hypothetical protein
MSRPPLFAGASPTRDGLEDLYLFAGTRVLDKMAEVDDAISTGVGPAPPGPSFYVGFLL